MSALALETFGCLLTAMLRVLAKFFMGFTALIAARLSSTAGDIGMTNVEAKMTAEHGYWEGSGRVSDSHNVCVFRAWTDYSDFCLLGE